ncbi:MAG: GDYXXLXY domain-containing protein [Xanthomonadales bacterium]|nr:GDYXXLXY domain-containing protein [Xanthomonadales bacterium]
MKVRDILLIAGLLLALAVVNMAIGARERLLREGTPVLLALAPVDPRALLQGDYMALDWAIARDVEANFGEQRPRHGDGYAVLALSADGTTSFLRNQAQAGPVAEGEVALRWRLRGGRVRIVTNAWFFPEGQAERYQSARHGELRVGADGEALLVAMRGGDLAAP